MKLMKATLARLWRLTRTASIVVGLAVLLALVAGVTSLAAAKPPSGGATASAILKGVSNTANTATTLINSGTGPALSLQVGSGNPPLTVNSDAGTATNLSADKLDGKDSTAFVSATNGKAPDSELLDGKDSTEFLGATAKAADSDKLDGKDSTEFAAASTGKAFFVRSLERTGDGLIVQKGLEAGDYVITGSVHANSHSEDVDDAAVVLCDIKLNGTTIAETVESPGTFTDPLFNGDASLSMTTAHSAANGDTLFLNCHQLFSDSTTYKGTLTAIRVSSIE